MHKTFVIAEIGINHNGDIKVATDLIEAAKFAGADAVKFQKRNINKVYTKEYLDSPRKSPWGTTQRDQKKSLELGVGDYDVINDKCKDLEIEWFASAWDLDSVKFLKEYNLCYNKIASAMLTHKELVHAIADQKKHTFISTGMSTLDEIQWAVDCFNHHNCPFELMHCNSEYPMNDRDANLKCIPMLKSKFNCEVGYSGHEVGIITSVAAVVMGATSIERHITLDRSMYGSDQASSVEPIGFYKMVDYIKVVETCLGDGIKKITENEEKAKSKLRRTRDI